MRLYAIVLKNIRQRALASTLTIISITLGVALVAAILLVRTETESNFFDSADGWDLIVGYKGSPLEIVLCTVFNLAYASNTTPMSVYEQVLDDPRVEFAIPFCTGVSYRDFPVVATSRDLYDRFEYQRGRFLRGDDRSSYVPGKRIEMLRGDWFTEKRGEAVIGAFVEKNSPLQIDSTFYAGPSVIDDETARKFYAYYGQPCKVVGVMAPTGTPIDKCVYVSLNTWFNFEGHVIERKDVDRPDESASPKRARLRTSVERLPDEESGEANVPALPPGFVGPIKQRETFYQITAIGVRLKPGTDPEKIVAQMDKSSDLAQAVIPAHQIEYFFSDILGWISALFIATAGMVVIVSAISIMVWIYNSMNERRRDIAIMRSLGASRWTVFSSILLESATLCAVGAFLGIPVAHFAVLLAGNYIHLKSGILIHPWSFAPYEILLFVGTAILGAVVGILPAVRAYETDVAQNLNPLT